MDMLVLIIVNKIMHYHTTLSRILSASALGAVWSIIAVIFPDKYKLFVNLCTYFIVTGLMLIIINSPLNIIRAAGGNRGRYALRNYLKELLKGIMVMLSVACTLGGAMHILVYYTYAGYIIHNVLIKNRQMLIITAITIFFVFVVIRIMNKINKGMSVYKVAVTVGNECIVLRGIIDTGNQLMDMYAGKPVNVMDKVYFNKVLSKINDYSRLKYHLIPYRTVGNNEGMIEVITADYMYISDDSETKAYENVLIGLSDVKVSEKDDYQVLINGQMIM